MNLPLEPAKPSDYEPVVTYTREQWEKDREALKPLILYRTIEEWAVEAKEYWLRGLFPTPGNITLDKGSQQILYKVTPTNADVRKTVMGNAEKPIEFTEATWEKFLNGCIIPERAEIESDRTVERDGKTPRRIWHPNDQGDWVFQRNDDGTPTIAQNKGMFISVTCLRPGLKVKYPEKSKSKRVTIALDNDVKTPRDNAARIALSLKRIMEIGQPNAHHNLRTSCQDDDNIGGLIWCQIDEELDIPEWLDHSKLSSATQLQAVKDQYKTLPLDVLTKKGTVFVGMHRKTGKPYRNTGKFNPTNFHPANLPLLTKARLWLISHLYERPQFAERYTTKMRWDDTEYECTPDFIVDKLLKMTAGQDRDTTCMNMMQYFYKLQHRGLKMDETDTANLLMYFSELAYERAGKNDQWKLKAEGERQKLRRQWGGITNIQPLAPEDEEETLSPLESELLVWRGEGADKKPADIPFKMMVKFLMKEDEERETNLIGREKRENLMYIDTLRHYRDGWWQPISLEFLRVELNDDGYEPAKINKAITLITDQAKNSKVSRMMRFTYDHRKDDEEAQETLMQIACTNGTIQLRNDGSVAKVEHDASHAVVNGVPFEYAPFETNTKPGDEGYLGEVYELYKGLCPFTIQHLDFMLPDPNDRYAALMYEGLMHFPITRFEKALELTGRGGTGKTVWAERLTNIFTSNNTRADVMAGRKEIQKFSRCSLDAVCEGFNRTALRGKLIHFVDDVGSPLNSTGTEFWRSLVSGVSMNIRDVYEPASAGPTPLFARLWLNSNNTVQYYGSDSDAIRRRRLILHVNEVSREELPEDDPNRTDTNAPAKLASKKELQASFNLAIQMFQHVLALGKFPISEAQSDRAASEAKYDNIFESFVCNDSIDVELLLDRDRFDANGNPNYENWIYLDDLMEQFRTWANDRVDKNELSEGKKNRLFGAQGKNFRAEITDWARLSRAGEVVMQINIPMHLDTRPEKERKSGSRQKKWVVALKGKQLPTLRAKRNESERVAGHKKMHEAKKAAPKPVEPTLGGQDDVPF